MENLSTYASLITSLVHCFGIVLASYKGGNVQCDSFDACSCDSSASIDISHSFDYPVMDIADSEDPDQYIYQFSPCGPPTDCDTEAVGNETAAVCQVFRNSSFNPVKIGLVSSSVWTVESVNLFTVSYIGGDLTFDGFKRQAQVYFTVQSATKSNSIAFLGSKRNNLDKLINYNFQVTLAGGPRQSLVGIAGFIAMALLVVIVLLYLGIGSLYKVTTKQARGVEVIPNYDFWCDFPSLVKDGCCFVICCLHMRRRHDFGSDAYHSIGT